MIPWGWPSSEWHQPAGDSSDSPLKETVSEALVATSGLSSSIHAGRREQLNRVCVLHGSQQAGLCTRVLQSSGVGVHTATAQFCHRRKGNRRKGCLVEDAGDSNKVPFRPGGNRRYMEQTWTTGTTGTGGLRFHKSGPARLPWSPQ